MSEKKKQSLLMGALAGSFGVFLSKALGLFYVVPLNQLAGETNMAFYSIAYSYYDLLLKICGAGIPFAIAALVAKYYSRNDYKTVLLVRKLGTSFIMASSFIIAIIFLLIARPLATSTMGVEASAEDVNALYNLFRILTIAIIFVPLLSSIRGYYQGLKRMDVYASSQVIEQFVRVFGIIALGYIFVQILSFDGIWAIYMAMLSASIAAVITIIYMLVMTRKQSREVIALAKGQSTSGKNQKEVFIELISLGIPYVIISFLGTSSSIVNSNFFMSYAPTANIAYEDALLVLGILQVNCNKIAAIPQVLTLGFSAGLVPYLTESLEKQDYRLLQRQLSDIFNTVFYLLIPVVMAFILFAKAIYFIMYGNANLDLGSEVFMISNLQTITDTIAPILSSILITLRHRKSAIGILAISFAIKFISFFPFISLTGYAGMIYSSVLCSLVVIVFGFVFLKKNYNFKLKNCLKKLLFIFISSILCMIPSLIISFFVPFNYDSKLVCLLLMVVYALISGSLYLVITYFFYLPQSIFHVKGKDILKVFTRFRA